MQDLLYAVLSHVGYIAPKTVHLYAQADVMILILVFSAIAFYLFSYGPYYLDPLQNHGHLELVQAQDVRVVNEGKEGPEVMGPVVGHGWEIVLYVPLVARQIRASLVNVPHEN